MSSNFPDIAKEWNIEKNDKLKPVEIASKSSKKWFGGYAEKDMNGQHLYQTEHTITQVVLFARDKHQN